MFGKKNNNIKIDKYGIGNDSIEYAKKLKKLKS